MKKLTVLIGILLIGAAAVVKLGIGDPMFSQRFPDGWSYQAEVIGSIRYAEVDGTFPTEMIYVEDDEVSLSTRTIRSEKVSADVVKIIDHYVSYDINTNAVTWEVIYEAQVNPTTGQHIGEFVGDYFFFPRNVQKTTYRIRNTAYEGLPVVFEDEEVVQGLLTYHFVYQDAASPNPAGYPDFSLEPGQTIISKDMRLEYWVEPLTGEVIKYWEGTPGDALVNTETGEIIQYISRWSGATSPQDVIKHVNDVTAQLNMYRLLTIFIPSVLAIAGVILLAVGVMQHLPRVNQANGLSH
jgi:hypothetical protein